MTFKEAFAKARKEKGPGKTFTWNGKSYTTDYATEKKKDGPRRPKARPTAPRTSKRPPRTHSDSGSKVTTTKLDKKETKSSGPSSRPKVNTPKKDSSKKNSPGKMPVDTRKKPVTGRTKSPTIQRIKKLLGIGADMPPQQKTGRRSKQKGGK